MDIDFNDMAYNEIDDDLASNNVNVVSYGQAKKPFLNQKAQSFKIKIQKKTFDKTLLNL